MNILWLIISIVVHFFIAFVLMYCCDNAEIWKDGKEIKICKPSVNNLKSLDNVYYVNKYVENVIQPSHHYFILRNTIKAYQGNEGCSNELAGIVLQVFSLLFIMRNAVQVFPNKYLHKALYLIIIGVVCLAVCCLGCYIIRKVYKKHFALRSFCYSREDLKQRFVYDDTEHDISEEDAFNNYVIMCHYNYLLSIEDTVIFRKNIMKVITWASTIIYILFFMRTPD